MSEIALSLKNVCVGYNKKIVAQDISLAIPSGSVFGLIGLNGAGKTTLIKTILGLKEQHSGDIHILGKNKSDPQTRSFFAYLPEKFEPPWFLTGMEFLKFSLNLYKEPFSEDLILETAQNLALDTYALGRRMNTYSKGMRQKLGLMGTLLTGGRLFMLDEPMSGLDPQARALVKKMILDMKHKERTIFFSSHILADMDEICDSVAVLHKGEICYIGTPKNLKKQTNAQNLEQAFLDYIEEKKVV